MRSFHARRAFGTLAAGALAASTVIVGIGGQQSAVAQAARPTQPQLINLTQYDLEFILSQILISEAHPFGTDLLCTAPDALTNPAACTTSIPNVNRQFGLRQTNGEHNNLIDGRATWGSSLQTFPRLTAAVYRPADGLMFDPDGPGPLAVGDPTSYAQNAGIVVDAEPRLISNLISDQTERNPAAIAAAAETQGHGFGATTTLVDHDRNPDTAPVVQYELPNVAPDAGFSASYNSLFTLFGQFFDHGLDLAAKGGSGTVIVPLQQDDPLYIPGSATNFMVLTRATNQPGPDGELGTEDDVKDATNQVTPYIDNNQTYTSHPSHQVFLREYVLDAASRPVATGRLLDGADGGLATWKDIKAQAENLLGIHLEDSDVGNVPLIATDVYGRFLPGVDGYPQIVMPDGTTMEGNPMAPVSPTAIGGERTGIAFLNDIAHHAAPGTWDDDHNPGTPAVAQTADPDLDSTLDDHMPGTYDDEMLGAHYICGDGRCNENIGLTAIHDIFHTEHNTLVAQLEQFIPTIANTSPAALGSWLLPDGSWNGERIFQAAKFINEMEYQHIVFGEFARAIQPNVDLFGGYDPSKNPAITAEFAHAVYRFGHSMLTESMARTNADGSRNDMSLMQAFLNPTAFNDGGAAGHLTNEQASGSIVRGMVNQRGEEIDEFITEALRNNLVGLPLDLGTLNITRARSEGMGSLNELRRELFTGSIPGAAGNTQLKPYHDWADFGMALRHESSLVNFIAAYGTHPTIVDAVGIDAKRAAAQDIVDLVTPGAQDFLDGTGTWVNVDGRSVTGLEDVDLWIGGLAEAPPLFGGMLGSTFNYVFETQMEALQNNDRLYYLARTEGMPLLTELEGNTFSDLIRRNTDAVNIPVMAFTRTDYTFDLSAQTNPTGVVDDPATPYNEPNLDGVSKIIRMADGTLRLTGKGTTENHSTWLGTNDADKVRSAEGDDSLWGNDGDDRLEGGIGADMIEGNDGNDILTDISGDDVISGGNGNDVILPGNGLDILLGDNGDDAVLGGVDDKEQFFGAGDDLLYGGAGADAAIGGDGQDWLEGGLGGDALSGDNLAEFPPSVGEDDVLIGGGGEDGYHADGGMDIMLAGDGVDTVVAGLGFDFVSYSRSSAPAFANLSLPPLVGGGAANPRDRFSLTEGVTGSPFDDVLRGDDRVRPVGHELTQASLDKITGLEDLLNLAGLVSAPGVVNRFDGDDMVFGGGGSDQVEGGGGSDFIHGDASLDVRLECTKTDGSIVTSNTLKDIQSLLTSGAVDPGNCDIKREISFDSNGTDTAIFRCPMDQYVVGTFPDGRTVVTHIPPAGGGGLGGAGNCAPNGGGGGVVGGGALTGEGTDTLLGVEFAQFADGIIDLTPQAQNDGPVGTVSIDNPLPVVGDTLSVLTNFIDPQGYDPALASILWQTWDGVTIDPFNQNEPVWVEAAVADTYTVQPTDIGLQIRAIYQYTDNNGNSEAVLADPTAAVTSGVLLPPSATLALDVAPTLDTRTATLTATFLDGNGAPIDALVDFFQDGVPVGQAATDPATGIATLDVVLTGPTDTIVTFTAAAVDPAPLDVQFTTIQSLPAVTTASFPVVDVDAITSVTEGATGDVVPMTVTFTLDRQAVVDQLIDWVATGNTATDGADFTAASGQAVVPAGSTSTSITVDVLGDGVVEVDETIDVSITSPTALLGIASTQTGVIVDDDLPTLTLGGDQVATEGPASTVTFDLTLDQAPVNPVAVDWAIVSGTALPADDYVDSSGTVVFAPGDTAATVIVTLVDDSAVEFDENFTLQLGAVTGANGPATTSANALVQDDDVAVLSAGAAVSVVEGNTNSRTPMNFTLRLDRPSVHPISVSWRAGDGTASPRQDFVAATTAAATGTVTIPAGATSLTVPVTVIGDNTIEPNETVVFSITGVTNAVVSTVSATGTIVDDDTPPSARIANTSHLEGNSGFSFMTFTVTLNRAPNGPVSVVATTGNGTARAGSDYTAVRTVVRFAAGQTSATVQVPVVGDRVREADEQMVVRLSSPSGVTIGRTTATGTIVNDD